MGGIFSKDAHPTLQPGQRLHGFHGRVPEPPPAAGPGGTAPRAPAAASPQHRARHCLPGAAQASGLGTAAMEVGRDTPPTSPHPLHGGRASPPRLGRCRCQLSPARLLRSEIDFTLAGLETLARVFDSPASPRSPAREQVSPPPSTVAACSHLQVLWHAWVGAAGLQGRWGGSFGACRHPKVGGEAASPARPQGPPSLRVQPGPAGRNSPVRCHRAAPKMSLLPLRVS